jgi:DNA (cytosine-5)-methyltransferase 1
MVKPTVISTFAGCGGSSLGYQMAGFKELLAVEWDNNAAETFKLNFPKVPLFHGDIKELSVEKCLKLAKIKPRELDVFDGSPPCQGFSTAGKRKFHDPRNSLFQEYCRLLKGLQPKVFIMENVTGMVKGVMKQAYLKIISELRECGYKVQGEVMNAMYYGVPQSRQRVILIGVRKDLRVEPSHPKPQTKPINIRKIFPYITGHSRGQFDMKIKSNNTIAYTLTKKRTMEFIEKGEKRYPTINEAKIMGTFPKDFMFIGGEVTQWERIGNSVPPLLMEAIAIHIRDKILPSCVRSF